ncbi:bifunctional bis(5'-adenosyl)-triphosphatase/adenylylsulfatase FHIT-like [Pyrus x bretschneideri]|uniref:bifunctional bis(5'-adenosyl)-triphosphatase/adenylylsulfatase FHIT-like n=1 Tax=Pyrus x bretschneideri TaxID=225117 RepID=UPI00202DBBA3|nr:bifunctional bis(5'-adenosyl)-triphosphatase/adenylylsulfatase FHIT-like [Pyrus x bretschneideri]
MTKGRKILFPTVPSTVRSLITRSSSVARTAFLRPSYFSTPAKKPPIPALSFSLTSAAGTIHYILFIKRRQMASESFKFGPYNIDRREVFYSTKLSYALVNMRPLVPGHVLVCPRHEVKRFVDLTADETSDLWITAQKVGSRLESYHKASSLTFAIQDGPEAGQTVPHVHIHIIPRKGGDFEKNDEIYDALDEKEKELTQKLDLDKERKDKSLEEMAQEAEEYKKLF